MYKGLRQPAQRHQAGWLAPLIAAEEPLQRERILCRSFARSSGIICSRRSAIRRRKLERCEPPPKPPNRIRQSASVAISAATNAMHSIAAGIATPLPHFSEKPATRQ
jgi:hypothetical protein